MYQPHLGFDMEILWDSSQRRSCSTENCWCSAGNDPYKPSPMISFKGIPNGSFPHSLPIVPASMSFLCMVLTQLGINKHRDVDTGGLQEHGLPKIPPVRFHDWKRVFCWVCPSRLSIYQQTMVSFYGLCAGYLGNTCEHRFATNRKRHHLWVSPLEIISGPISRFLCVGEVWWDI